MDLTSGSLLVGISRSVAFAAVAVRFLSVVFSARSGYPAASCGHRLTVLGFLPPGRLGGCSYSMPFYYGGFCTFISVFLLGLRSVHVCYVGFPIGSYLRSCLSFTVRSFGFYRYRRLPDVSSLSCTFSLDPRLSSWAFMPFGITSRSRRRAAISENGYKNRAAANFSAYLF